jgi:hypothetical protein
MYSEMKSIEVIEGCTPDLIPETVLASTRPLVLKGLVADWPIVESAKKSSADVRNYLEQFYDGALVNAAYGDSGSQGEIFYNSDLSGFTYQRKQVRLDTVMNDILACEHSENAPVYYIDSAPVDYCVPGFRHENTINLGEHVPRVSLWMGNKTVVSAHYDIPDNIACVVAGKRRFVLFPPEQLANLYIGPLDFNPAGPSISMVNLKNPDFEKFPLFRNALAAAQVAELEAGDALYIPSMWWHHVEGLASFNALVNFWWNSSPAYLGSPLDVFNHALMNIKSLPDDERKSWKNLFDHYVFDSKPESFSHIPKERLGVLGEVDEAMVRRMRSMLLNRLNR